MLYDVTANITSLVRPEKANNPRLLASSGGGALSCWVLGDFSTTCTFVPPKPNELTPT